MMQCNSASRSMANKASGRPAPSSNSESQDSIPSPLRREIHPATSHPARSKKRARAQTQNQRPHPQEPPYQSSAKDRTSLSQELIYSKGMGLNSVIRIRCQ